MLDDESSTLRSPGFDLYAVIKKSSAPLSSARLRRASHCPDDVRPSNLDRTYGSYGVVQCRSLNSLSLG